MQSMDSMSVCLGYLSRHPGIKSYQAKWLEGSLTTSVWPMAKPDQNPENKYTHWYLFQYHRKIIFM